MLAQATVSLMLESLCDQWLAHGFSSYSQHGEVNRYKQLQLLAPSSISKTGLGFDSELTLEVSSQLLA